MFATLWTCLNATVWLAAVIVGGIIALALDQLFMLPCIHAHPQPRGDGHWECRDCKAHVCCDLLGGS